LKRGAPGEGFRLRAGPLTAVLDRGELRWIRLGDREVLRGIYGAVRAPEWVTVPPRLSALRVEAGEEAFGVCFEARHEDGALRFAWTGRIEGDRDGTLRYVFDGRAETTFLKNRVGLCVLHPSEVCAGRPCLVEHGDGRTTRGVFPFEVSPHQPFLDIRAIRHAVVPGRGLEVRFDGEWFEMEDHRNWSDASFKTYSTPVDRPFPARLEAGTPVRHEVTVRLVPGEVEGPGAEPPATVARLARLRVGLSLGGQVPSSGEVESLRALRLDHLRVDLSLDEAGWPEALARGAEAAGACGLGLETAAVVPDAAEEPLGRLAEACAKLAPPVATFLLFRRATGRSDPELLEAGRRGPGAAVPGSRVGGGAAGWFAELNRNRRAASGADVVAFELSPQLHARDEATILENLASLRDMARTARGFAEGAELGLSPVTLAPRREAPDPRLVGDFGGEWMRGLLRAAREAGFASLTLAPALGPGGVVQAGAPTPAAEALRERDAAPIPRPTR
jgi:hypothetical protein